MKLRIWLSSLVLLLTAGTSTAVMATSFDNKAGYVSAAIPAIAGVYTLSIEDYPGLKQWTLSTLVTAQLTVLLKNSVQRTRPNQENDQSFPSGHTAAAFMGASYLQHRYGWSWGVPMYAIATVIGLERVNSDNHYWSDVLAGAALGWAVSWYFTAPYPHVKVAPQFNPRNRSLGLQFQTNFH